MCKLCNTDRPATKLPSTTILQITVHEYLGEYCCGNCYTVLAGAFKKDANSLDRVILQRLYRYYRTYDAKALTLARSKANMRNTQIYIGSAFGIRITNSEYRARINRTYLGTYSTLTEALEVKLKYCIENGHKRAITQTKIKLKELQCKN